jgi:hypothetical protein
MKALLLAAALVALALPAVAQHTSTLNYSITVTNEDPQITFMPAGSSYVSCTATPGEHLSRIGYSGSNPTFPTFFTNDTTGSFVVEQEFDGVWLEVSQAGIAPSLCGTTTTLAVTAQQGCTINLAFDGTVPCNAITEVIR